MNRTIKEATVKRGHYNRHAQLTVHPHDFIDACSYGPRLKTLKGLTPFEHICKIWTIEPDRFILNTTHQMQGLKHLVHARTGVRSFIPVWFAQFSLENLSRIFARKLF